MEKYYSVYSLVNAIKWTGDNIDDINTFLDGTMAYTTLTGEILRVHPDGDDNYYPLYVGDYVIKRVVGNRIYAVSETTFDFEYYTHKEVE